MRFSYYPTLQVALLVGATLSCVQTQRLSAQRQDIVSATRVVDSSSAEVEPTSGPAARIFSSRADSLAWTRARTVAEGAKGLHVTISLKDRQLWAIDGQDTLLNVSVAVAKGERLAIQGRVWTFVMPRGVRTVRGKEADPIWVPPDWLYAETAVEHGLRLATMRRSVPLTGGRRLEVRDSVVGLIEPGTEWSPLPVDEHIVFDGKLFIPPAGTINRRIEGQLGKYRLDLGEGFLLHGTPYQSSIGTAATHGCVRLRDQDILWLYEHVPVGTKVYIY